MEVPINHNPPLKISSPAISVIIPMYNAEKYIAECLDSLLAQTFHDFEVIVADDCSTDSSYEIVESYMPKFDGRLSLIKTEKNSGGGGYIPRNLGFKIASGEYAYFLDADDFILGTALENLYNNAKEYNADVVYMSARYMLTSPNEISKEVDVEARKLLKEGLENKLTLTVDNPVENLNHLFTKGNFHAGWTKFSRRDFLIENNISFPDIKTGGDFIWGIHVYCCSKRFLRLPVPLYIYRYYGTESVTKKKRAPLEQICHWVSSFVAWSKAFYKLANEIEVLKKNQNYCYRALELQFKSTLKRAGKEVDNFYSYEIYELLCNELAKENDLANLNVPFFFSNIIDREKSISRLKEDNQKFRKLTPYITARVDVKLLPQGEGDFQIVSISDDKASVLKPAWLQKDGIGYQIQSYASNMEILAKATADGQILLKLKAMDIRDPKDKSRRVPYWIDYTSLTINGEKIFERLTPAWHDKPYNYTLDVKAGDEVTIQTEWLPHGDKKLNEAEDDLILIDRPIICSVSVVVSLYNYEKYIGECLDSLLAQTFQDFEVIVVDDCSTDNSLKIAESYVSKFNGRLQTTQTKMNSGGGGVPRNKGLELANGEYVFFMDADDALTKTALEEMYTLAKNYGADVVYCEKYYMSEGVGQEFKDKIHLADRRIQKPPFVNKPTFETNNLEKRIKDAIEAHYWMTPWLRLVQRKLLIEHKILFDSLIGSNDVGWTFRVLFCSKRFLRIPNICYVRRMHNESTTLRKRTNAEYIHKWMDRSIRSLKQMDEFMSDIEFFKANPKYRYDVIESFMQVDFIRVIRKCSTLSPYEIYNIFREKFGDYLGKNDVLVSCLCAYAFDRDKILAKKYNPLISKLNPYITARIDVKLVSQNEGNFQIIFVSDDKANVKKATWLPENEVGYFIQSYSGNIEIIAKATADGQIRLNLRGMDIRDPKDKTKRIPHWIDYTNLKVNGKKIFNKLTPAWHDAPYNYTLNVKADDEIKIQTEWLPHNGEVVLKKSESIVSKKFLPYLTARMDIQLVTQGEGDFKIFSISDNKANIKKADWLPENEIGYFVHSCNGNMKIVVKATVDGQIKLGLKGMDIRDPQDMSKRVPYWIDYTNLTVNGEKIFDKLTPVWHDDPYNYTLNVKADDEIKIQTEWLPHNGEVVLKKSESIVSKKFLPYLTARMDIQLVTQGEGDFKILSISDNKANIKKADWLPENEIGYFVHSCNGNIEIIAKATADGQIRLNLRGMDIRDPKDKTKRIPHWIDYTNLKVNGKKIFNKLTPVWHDAPYNYTLNVKADDEIKIQTEWLPHNGEASESVVKRNEPIVSRKFLPYLTARVDVKLVPQGKGDFQIISVSDDKANVRKATWLPKNEIGYFIQSYNGNMKIVVKATVGGQIQLMLKGMDIRDSKNKSKRIPYWIDYTNLTINGKTIFDNLIPVWHDNSYDYALYIKAGEELKIETEWLPHGSDT